MRSPLALIFLLWFLAALAGGGTGLLAALEPPIPQLIVVGLTMALIAAGLWWPAFRRWVDGFPWKTVVAILLVRFVGGYFLVLARRGELAREFAVPAGIGGLVVAALAVLLLVSGGTGSRPPRVLLTWNVVGLADMLMVVVQAAR